jgi:multiple sugar transport system ATP-binding protein
MNLIAGAAHGGTLRHSSGSLPAPRLAEGNVTLGFRPEDAELADPETADIRGEVFSSELLGDIVLVGVRAGQNLVNVKVGAEGGRRIGEPVGIRVNPHKIHAFAATGERLPEPQP